MIIPVTDIGGGMKHAKVSDEETVEAVEGAFVTQLVSGDRTSAQVFEAEPGAIVPEHSHPHEQIGFVYEGTLTFLVDGETIEVGPNESFVIPGDEPHQIENRGETNAVGIDIFSPARPNPDWANDDSE